MSETTPCALIPGTIVNDHYQVVKQLGQGAMGAVLLATDLTLDRFVAIKVLHSHVGERFSEDLQFLREARLLSRLTHPNVVTIHAFARTAPALGGRHFIVMEYVAGRTLEDQLRDDGPLPPRAFCHVMTQVCSALAEAHRRGIVHRDLKPGNILVSTVGGDPHFVKVVDFGLAKTGEPGHLDDGGPVDAPGVIAGTPAYMSPEQVQGGDVDARGDIYSLGVLASELLTGHHPFEETAAIALMLAHVSQPPRLPSRLRPDLALPPGGPVDAALARAMAKDPAERQADARALAAELVHAVRTWQQDRATSFDLAAWSDLDAPPQAPGGHSTASAARDTSRATHIDPAAGLATGGTTPRHVAVLYVELDAASVTTADTIEDHLDCLAVVASKVRQAVLDAGGQLIGPLAERQIALFGLGADDELAIEEAVAAGLAIRSALSGLADDPTIPETFDLTFRLGVDAGPMVVGDVRDAGVIAHGEPLFGARAVARDAAAGEVRLSQPAYRVVRGLFECQRAQTARGAGAQWTVVGRKAVARHTGEVGLHGVSIGLIGRRRELDVLVEAVDEAVRYRCVVPVLVHGPPGVGKTRLTRELARVLDERRDAYFYESGRCTPGGHSAPYEPFVQALRARAHLEEHDDAQGVRDKIAQYVRRWAAHDPTALDAEEERLRHGLEELLLPGGALGHADISHAATLAVQGDEARRAALFESVAALYRRASRRYPLVLVIDDFQWASAPTRQLLAYLSAHLDGPALILVLQRDDGDDPAPEGVFPDLRDVRRLRLAPLSQRQTGRLVKHALRRLVEVPGPLLRAIRDLAQGIPLIVEETIHDLVDDGVIAVEDSRWRLDPQTPLHRIALPSTVAQLLAGRYARLPGELQEPLEAAAVAGRRSWPGLLAELTDGRCGRETLAELERRGFLAPLREVTVDGAHDWGFTQVAMRETVYGLVGRRRKASLHRRVAEWLEHRAGGSAGHLDDEIGYHFQEAGDAPRALTHRLRAARRARAVYAIEESLRHLDACRALAAQTRHPELQVEVLEDIVHQRALAGDLQGAAQAADELLAVPDLAADRRVRVAVRKAWVLLFLGRYREAGEVTEEAADHLDAAGDGLLALRVATLRAGVTAKMGDAAAGACHAREAIRAQGGRQGDAATRAALSEAYRTLGNCEVWQGRHEQARAAYDTAYALAVEANAPEMIVDALNGLAALAYFQGDPHDAVERWRQALETAERWDLLQHRLILLNNLAEVTWSRGDLRGAVDLAARAEALGRFLGTDEAQADAHRIHAEALLALGELEDATSHGRRAVDHAERVGSPHFLGPAHRTLATVLQARIGGPDAGADASPREVAQHLDAALAAFEGAKMEAEVEATRALRVRYLGG